MQRARKVAFAALVALGAVAVDAAPPPPVWQGTTEIATGRAEQGPWRQTESRYDYVDDPTVAIDGKGGIAVAWVDQKRKAVLLQRYSAAGTPQLAQPTDVSRQPATFSWLPRLAFGAREEDLASVRRCGTAAPRTAAGLSRRRGWSQATAGGRHARRRWRWGRTGRCTSGRSFEPPREISAPMPAGAVSASYPSLAADGRGNVIVTWELARAARHQPRGLAVVVSKDGGGSFSPPALVPASADPKGGSNGSRHGLLMKKLAVGEQGAVAVVNSSFQAGVRSRVWLVRGALQR